jgi:hypothetical protein
MRVLQSVSVCANMNETTISALEKEQETFAKTLRARTITEQQITSLQEFAEQITDRIDVVAADFASMRRVLELLDMKVVLAVEDGHKVIYVTCGLGSSRVSPTSQSTSGCPGQTGCRLV